MGMLLHHTWLDQQNDQEPQGEVKTEAPAEENEPETVKEPAKRGRRKTTK